jgi:anti-anti-sigma factor
LKLAGDVTVFQAAELHQASLALAQHDADLDVHCEEVLSMDCAAIQVLLALKEAMTGQGRTFRLLEPSEELQKTFVLAGLAGPLGLA